MFNTFRAADTATKGLDYFPLPLKKSKRNMCDFSWNICLGVWIFILIKGDFQAFAEETYSPTEGIEAEESAPDLPPNGWQSIRTPPHYPDTKHLLDFRESEKFSRHLFRRKRSIFFPAGVKVCPDESIEQAIVNHLKYFRLRVCQEAVWEIFKTFWDRLPGHEEYRNWLHLCEEGTMSIFEMGTNFSQSEEHQSLIIKKLSYAKEAMGGSCSNWSCGFGVPTPSPTGDATTVTDAAANVPPPDVVSVESPSDSTTEKMEDSETNNEIKRDEKLVKPAHEQIVEFSILLPEEKYTDELSDPFTEDYQQLALQFVLEIQNAYEDLPGYKNIHVAEFRSSQDDSGVEVLYSVVFDGEAISNATWDLMNLQSNKVEDNSFLEIEDNPTVVYTFSDFTHYIAEILHKNTLLENASLNLDPDSLQLINVKEVFSSVTEDLPRITARPIDDDRVVASEWPSADESTISNISPLDFTRPGFIFDIEQYNANEIWLRPDGYLNPESNFSSTPKATFHSKSDITIPPDLLFVDEKQDSYPVTPDSPEELESISNLSSLEDGLGDAEELLLPSSLTPHIVSSEILPTSDIVTPPTPTSPVASVSAIEPSTEEPLTMSNVEEETLQPNVYTEDNIDYYGSGSGQEQQTNTWSWYRPALETEGSSMYDYKETNFILPSSKEDYTSQDLLDDAISLSSLEIEAPSKESVLATSTEIYSIIQLEDPSEHNQIISEISGIQDQIITEQSPTDYSNIGTSIRPPVSSSSRSALEKAEIILTANPSVESLVTDNFMVEQQIPDTIVQGASGSIALKPIVTLSAESSTHQPTDEVASSVVSTGFDVSTMVPYLIDMTTGSNNFIGEVSTTHITNTPPSSFDSEVSSSATLTITEYSAHALSDIPTTEPAIFQSTVIQAELEQDMITKNLEVMEQDHVGTMFYPSEMNQEERSMTESHVELSTSAHSTETASVARATHENLSNVTVPARTLVVFFSLRATNMMFSEDLVNKNSPEYKALEQRFLELLVPYLQSYLTGLKNLEILNFRNGSIVVNSRMKIARPVPRNVTNAVYMILEDFCNTAYQTMNLAIDKYSLDVESGDQADPCKFQACNEFSECLVNQWSGEAECVCYPGYLSIEGLPCNSICDLQPDFCQNNGKCDIIPGQGAICRCRVGDNWWYRGEHCEEYVSEPLVVGIAIASVAGFLLVASAIIFFLARTLRDQYSKSKMEDSLRQGDSLSSVENAVKYNPMYESDATGHSHYYRRYPQLTSYSSTSNETSTEYSSEEIRHIYEHSELTKEEIQDRIRIIELYAKDRQFAEFIRQHQMKLL